MDIMAYANQIGWFKGCGREWTEGDLKQLGVAVTQEKLNNDEVNWRVLAVEMNRGEASLRWATEMKLKLKKRGLSL